MVLKDPRYHISAIKIRFGHTAFSDTCYHISDTHSHLVWLLQSVTLSMAKNRISVQKSCRIGIAVNQNWNAVVGNQNPADPDREPGRKSRSWRSRWFFLCLELAVFRETNRKSLPETQKSCSKFPTETFRLFLFWFRCWRLWIKAKLVVYHIGFHHQYHCVYIYIYPSHCTHYMFTILFISWYYIPLIPLIDTNQYVWINYPLLNVYITMENHRF